MGITADGAANNDKNFFDGLNCCAREDSTIPNQKSLDISSQRFFCFLHVINLGAKDLISFFSKKSDDLSEEAEDYREDEGIESVEDVDDPSMEEALQTQIEESDDSEDENNNFIVELVEGEDAQQFLLQDIEAKRKDTVQVMSKVNSSFFIK